MAIKVKVHDKWMRLPRLLVIADDPDSMSMKRKRFVVLNAGPTTFCCVPVIRLGCSGMINSLSRLWSLADQTGNLNCLHMMTAFAILMQVCMNRCLCCLSLMNGDNLLERVLHQISCETNVLSGLL